MREETIKIFKFDELDSAAKKKAIDEYREESNKNFDSHEITEILKEKLADHGLGNLDCYWSLSYSQGDGVAFYGLVDIAEFIKKNPKFDITTKLQKALETDQYFSIKIIKKNPHYDHCNSMRLEIDACNNDDLYVIITYNFLEFCQKLSKELESIGYKAIEFRNSDEYIIDEIEGRELEFFESGSMSYNL